jgi:4-hydroxythreonine-4-phosphate dehydrogenase
MGDAAGIGPELCLHLLRVSRRRKGAFLPLVVGSAELLAGVAQTIRVPFDFPVLLRPPAGPTLSCAAVLDLGSLPRPVHVNPGYVQAACGAAAAQFIAEGVRGCLCGAYAALCTAPLAKEALSVAGIPYPGHTEMLAALTHTRRFAMLLHGGGLSVGLVTCHRSLASVPGALTSTRIVEVGLLTTEFLRRANIGGKNPRLAVLGLNPHAGENGMFGREEAKIILPAIKKLRKLGVNAVGPLPPDTAFIAAARRRFHGHVAMYHDQGLIVLKALAFDRTVNVTLGLPIIRTSPDHGTAFDLAWRGKANPSSFMHAYALAERMAHR